MVVMAIIAILATAGLSAYTGYIKKARDTKRIADIRAINTLVLGMMSTNGLPPQTAKEVYDAVVAANNGKMLYDPIDPTGTMGVLACMSQYSTPTKECYYSYRICDGGVGYAVGVRFESTSNIPLYLEDKMPLDFSVWSTKEIYELGSCTVPCTDSVSGCYNFIGWNENLPTKIRSGTKYLLERGY